MNKSPADVFAELRCVCYLSILVYMLFFFQALALAVAVFELLQLPLRSLPLCTNTFTELNPNPHLNKYNWIDLQ